MCFLQRTYHTLAYLSVALPMTNKQVKPWGRSLQWHHNGRNSVSNHQPHDWFLNRLFRRRSKETSKLRVNWPLWGDFTGDPWIPRTNGQLRGKCFHLMTSPWWPMDILIQSNVKTIVYNQIIIGDVIIYRQHTLHISTTIRISWLKAIK